MRDLLETQIKGYKLVQLIGSGGFGAVYRAHQASVDREVAIKVIIPEHANNPKFIRNFDSEAHLIARLEHPYVVPLFDYWREPDGAYIIMRYYAGGSLSQLIINQGALPPEEAARILDQIASALDAAHRSNMIHRDIKPANIMLDSQNNAYLGDFGLAKNLADDNPENRFVGSPAYVAPEVIMRQSPDARTDIYSLGMVAHEMLTGKYAYLELTPDSAIHSILDFHLNEPMPEIPHFSDAVNSVLMRATAKDPDDRYDSAGAFAAAFRDALQHEGTSHLIPTDIPNPYKGLRAFEEADAGTFFGRENLVRRLLDRMEEDSDDANFLALVGPSGSGKSSILYAGLLPALRQGAIHGSDDWYIVDMMPGSEPIKQLSAALRSIAINPVSDIEEMLWQAPDSLHNLLPEILHQTNDTVLLVIDHFEEVFTQTANPKERKQFLSLIREGLKYDNLRVITLLRADFYDRPMMYEGFGALIQARTEVVLPLNSVDLNHVIVDPAKMVGLEVQPELTAAMVADVREEIAALPLLQYALTEMFEHKDSNVLTLEAYQAIGGVAGALAHRADEIYATLSPPAQQAARQIFLRLVTLGEGTEDTRRRAKRSELLSVVGDNNRILQSVLDTFGNYRLLTFDNDEETREPTVEVAHEALIREWQQLRKWLDASRDDIRQQRAIYHSAIEWQDANHDVSYLLRGSHLTQLIHWKKSTRVRLNDLEERYLKASVNEMEREQEAESRRQQHELALEEQSRQRLRYFIYVLLVAVVGAILLTTYAFAQSNQARQARIIAENARSTSDANVILAQEAREESDILAAQARSLALAASAQEALLLGDSDTALALAMQAIDIEDGPLSEPPELAIDTFLDISHAPGMIYERRIMDSSIDNLAVSLDGRFALASTGLNQTDLWGFGRPPEVAGTTVIFPDPDKIEIIVWDIDERTEYAELKGHRAPITDMIFLPETDSEIYRPVTVDGEGRIIFWDIENKAIRFALDDFQPGYTTLSTNADGTVMLVASSVNRDAELAGTLSLVDTETGAILKQIPELHQDLLLAELAPDGRHIVSMYRDGLHIVWDWQNEVEVAQFQAPDGIRFASARLLISPVDDVVVTNTGGIEVYLWDIKTGEQIGVARAETTISHQITFDSTGEYLYTLSRDAIVSTWNITGNYLENDLQVGSGATITIALLSDDETALIGTREGVLRLYAVVNYPVELINTFSGEGISFGGTIVENGDNTYLIAASIDNPNTPDGSLVVWDVATQEVVTYLARIPNRERTPYEFSLSADGQLLMGISQNLISLWDMNTGEKLSEQLSCPICEPRATNAPRMYADFVPMSGLDDTSLIIVAVQDNKLLRWNVSTGEVTDLQVTDEDTIISELDVSFDGEVAFIVVEPKNARGNRQNPNPPPRPEGAPPPPRATAAPDGEPNETQAVKNKLLWIEITTGDVLYEVELASNPESAKFLPESLEVAVGIQVAQADVISDARREHEENETEDEEHESDEIQNNDNTIITNAIVVAIINPITGEIEPRFVGHDSAINTINFSSDGLQMVTGGADRNVIVWDVRTGQITQTIAEYSVVLDAMFALDDTAIVTIIEDFEPGIWHSTPLTLEEGLAWASANRAVREADEGECRRYQMQDFCH